MIVTADHGEALYEHGCIGHNVAALRGEHARAADRALPARAGAARAARRARWSDLLDVAPTIADVFGVLGQGGSDREFQGRSLLPVIGGRAGQAGASSRARSGTGRVYALRDERYKLVYDTRTGEEELFDLAADPGESTRPARPRSRCAPPTTARPCTTGSRAAAARGRVGRRRPPRRLTREQCENLKALGYLRRRHQVHRQLTPLRSRGRTRPSGPA